MSARFLQRIASAESPALLLKSWLFCAVYCAISFSIFYVFAFRAREIMPTLIGGFFALFGVVYVWVTFQKTLEYLRFGEVSLRLESAPALGGELLARLLWPAEGVRELRVELSASEWKTEKDSRGREVRRERVRWREERSIPAAGETAIFYRSWYRLIVEQRVQGKLDDKRWARAIDEINEFEAQQRDHGTMMAKLFFHVTAEKQAANLRVRRRTSHATYSSTPVLRRTRC